jgi:hypothetical protein
MKTFHNSLANQNTSSQLHRKQTVEGYWYNSKNTYKFYRENDRIVVIASLDTISLIANFEEYAL